MATDNGKKYEILLDTKTYFKGKFIYRIRALKDFADVKAGDLGGYIQSEESLSQEGDCWVYDNAKVYYCGQVYGNARVYGFAKIYDNAKVGDNAQVYGYAEISAWYVILGDSVIYRLQGY